MPACQRPSRPCACGRAPRQRRDQAHRQVRTRLCRVRRKRSSYAAHAAVLVVLLCSPERWRPRWRGRATVARMQLLRDWGWGLRATIVPLADLCEVLERNSAQTAADYAAVYFENVVSCDSFSVCISPATCDGASLALARWRCWSQPVSPRVAFRCARS